MHESEFIFVKKKQKFSKRYRGSALKSPLVSGGWELPVLRIFT